MREPRTGKLAVFLAAAMSIAACGAGPATQPAGVPAFNAEDDLALGLALLRDRDAATAQDVFESALKLEPGNARAMHGLAIAFFAQEQKDKAVIYLERAIRAAPSDRAIVHNLAAVRIATNEPMRAVKTLSDYVAALAKTQILDEPLVDALATALETCDERTRKARQWAISSDVLAQAITRLERARPGYRKFGSAWLNTEQLREIESHNKELRDEIERIGRRVSDTRQQLELTAQRRAETVRRIRTGFSQEWELEPIDQQMERQQRRIESLEREAQNCQGRMKTPNWPTALAILSIDASAAPAFDKVPLQFARKKPSPGSDPADATPPGVLFPAGPRAADVAEVVPKSITRFAAAFAVAPSRVVTSALAVDGASSVRVSLPDGSTRRAKVTRVDRTLGLAVLEIPDTHLAPIAIAERSLEGKVSVVSFPTLSLFEPHASSLPATVTQLDGELSVVMERSPGLSGGPAMADGRVVGVVMSDRLDVSPPVRLITAEQLRAFLGTDAAKDARPLAAEPEPAVLLVTAEHEPADSETVPTVGNNNSATTRPAVKPGPSQRRPNP
jgi:tetratricopeptide (TPR) repeat protein